MEKEIREVKIASNKNYIITQIYNLSGDITGQRINLKKFDIRKLVLAEKLEKLEKANGEGQALYEMNKEIKRIKKEIDSNDMLLEKTEDMLENFEEKCQFFEEELADAREYTLPQKAE